MLDPLLLLCNYSLRSFLVYIHSVSSTHSTHDGGTKCPLFCKALTQSIVVVVVEYNDADI